MTYPDFLQERIDEILKKIPPSNLRLARELLTTAYREKNSSESIFANDATKLAYLAARFPATYAAVSYVLRELSRQRPDLKCDTLLDLGAGPGTASCAALEIFPHIKKTVLIEKSPHAISLGKQLFLETPHEWICEDLKEKKEFPKANLAILSYSLGEIKPFTKLLNHLWDSEIDTIAIIEPGTPSGYQTILEARDFFIKKEGQIIAPCPHANVCPLKKGDWCHFSVRLERTKLHRFLKEGSLGFEDEKFSYLIVSKIKKQVPKFSRILRHPQKGSGHVRLMLCTEKGTQEEKIISRKDKDLYKLSRDSEWGDALNDSVENVFKTSS